MLINVKITLPYRGGGGLNFYARFRGMEVLVSGPLDSCGLNP